MAEERKVLLALDGSSNSECALKCKCKIAFFGRQCVRARSVARGEHTGACIRGCYKTSNREDSNQFSNIQR